MDYRGCNNIYVAGHNGMVGGAIVRALRYRGYQNIVTRDRHALDLSDSRQVRVFFDEIRPEVVFLCAARVGGIRANLDHPVEFLLENLQIQNNVIPIAAEYGVAKFVFLASSCMYPKVCHQPIKEEYLMTGCLEPSNEGYALAKISGVKLLEAFKKTGHLEGISLIPCNLYGPGDSFDLTKSHVLSALVKRFCDAKVNNRDSVTLWGTGAARRELMHVDDFASIAVSVFERSLLYDSINIGTGVDVQISELASMVSSVVGFSGAIDWDVSQPDGTPRKLLDISRLSALGLRSEISLDEGLRQMVSLYSQGALE